MSAARAPAAASAEAATRPDLVRGVLACLGAALSFAVAALLVKVCSQSFSTLDLLWARALLQVVVLAIAFAVVRESPWGPPELRGWLSLRGLLGVASVVGYFVGIILLPLADAIALYSTKPVIAALLGAALLGEPLGRWHAAGAALSVLGCALVAYSGPRGGAEAAHAGGGRAAGTWAVCVAALLAAGASVATRLVMSRSKIRAEVPVWYFAVADVAVLAAASPALRASRFSSRPPSWTWPHAAGLVGVGLCSLLGQQLMSVGYRHIRSALGALLIQTETAHAFALQALIFGHVGLQSVLGAVLVCAASGALAARELFGGASGEELGVRALPAGATAAAPQRVPRFSCLDEADEFNEDWT